MVRIFCHPLHFSNKEHPQNTFWGKTYYPLSSLFIIIYSLAKALLLSRDPNFFDEMGVF